MNTETDTVTTETVKIDTIGDYLKPVTLDDINIIGSYLQKYPCENCDFNICNLYGWNLSSHLAYTIYSGRMILFNPVYSSLFAPLGERFSAEELLQLSKALKKSDKEVEIISVSESYINEANLGKYFNITNDENSNNYVYTTEDLVHLTGKKLAKKKNLISQFHRLYPDFSLKPITADDQTEVMDFCYYWRKTHEVGPEYLDVEFEAIRMILKHWDIFPCNGLKLYVDGKICAFSIYSPQTPNMVTVHYEKYDVEVKGAGQVINHETAKILINDYKFINREEDMGFPGIRQAKRSYQPIKMLPYYRLRAK